MTVMWFGLAAIALAGAIALLYVDRTRRDQLGRVREMWSKAQGYTYSSHDDELVPTFRRALLTKPEHSTALDVVRGVRRGEKFVLFDVEDSSTIVAVQRPVGSDVDIELRPKSTPPPRDADMELLGSIGPRVVFATDIEVARRVCDQRMAAFTEAVPESVTLLWSENDWTLGALPLGSTGRDWDAAIDAVTRLSGMLHVLPPALESSVGPRRQSPAQQRRRSDESGSQRVRSDESGSRAPVRDLRGSESAGRGGPGARPAPRPPHRAPHESTSRPTPITRDADRRSQEN